MGDADSIQTQWRDSGEQKLAFLQFLQANGCPLPNRQDDYDFRHAELPFYPALAFCEVSDRRTGAKAYILIDPDLDGEKAWHFLDMTNGPIYALNADYLRLAAENVRQYVSFFFGAVAGPHGVMPVIERLDIPSDADDEAEAQIASLADVVPIKLMQVSDKHFLLGAALLFQGSVFRAKIAVKADGVVEIIEHELALATDEDEADDKEDGELKS